MIIFIAVIHCDDPYFPAPYAWSWREDVKDPKFTEGGGLICQTFPLQLHIVKKYWRAVYDQFLKLCAKRDTTI